MGMAWGIFAPLAIGSTFLRNHVNVLKSNANWFRVHLSLAILVAVLTGVGAVVAIVAEIRDEDGMFEENELFDDDDHEGIGYIIVGVVLLQVIAGFARPNRPVGAPKPSLTDDDDEGIFVDEEKHGDGLATNEEGPEGENSAIGTTITKSKTCNVRKLWEYTHRLFGILLLGLAWYNCHSGIFLFAEHFGPIDGLVKLFWGVTGSLSGIIFSVGCALRML